MDAKIDFGRRRRLGMIEAIWGENKTFDQISSILKSFKEFNEIALVTRVDIEKAQKILQINKEAKYFQNAKCLTLGKFPDINKTLGKVVIATAGSSDLEIAFEAQLALRVHAVEAILLNDLGVSGLHRLLDNLDKFDHSKVVIACAGMEGAMPTVLAGLIPQPIIGLPTSVGYGISRGGNTALAGMLASCAPGLSLVNIDNGYGAAMAALRILKTL